MEPEPEPVAGAGIAGTGARAGSRNQSRSRSRLDRLHNTDINYVWLVLISLSMSREWKERRDLRIKEQSQTGTYSDRILKEVLNSHR